MDGTRRAAATRRALLGAAAATVAGVAGCSGTGNDDDGDDADDGDTSASKVSLSFAETAETRAAKRQQAYAKFGRLYSTEATLERIRDDAVPGIIDVLENLGVTDIYAEDPPVDAMDVVDAAPTPDPVDLLTAATGIVQQNRDVGLLAVLRTGSITEFGDDDVYPGEAETARQRNAIPADDDADAEWTGGLAAKAAAVESAARAYRREETAAAARDLVAALRAEYGATEPLPELREWGRLYVNGYDVQRQQWGAKFLKRAARANVNSILGFRVGIRRRLDEAGLGTTPKPEPTATATDHEHTATDGREVDTVRSWSFPKGTRLFDVAIEGRTPFGAGVAGSDGWAVEGNPDDTETRQVRGAPDGDAAFRAATAGVDGGFVVAGVTGSDAPPGFEAGWLARVDGGSFTRSRLVGGDAAANDQRYTRLDAVASTGDGYVAAGQVWWRKNDDVVAIFPVAVGVDREGDTRWRRRHSPGIRRYTAVAPAADGALLGGDGGRATGRLGFVGVDRSGEPRFERVVDRDGRDQLQALVRAPDGYLAVSNRTEGGTTTGWVFGLTADGRVRWTARAPTSGTRFVDATTVDGTHWVVGQREGWAVLVGVTPAGEVGRPRRFTAHAGTDRLVAHAVDAGAETLLLGGFTGSGNERRGWLQEFESP